MADLQNTQVQDNSATVLPSGGTSDRPLNPEAGYTRFNTDENTVEFYNGTSWSRIDQTPEASSTGDSFFTDIVDNGQPYRVFTFRNNGDLEVKYPGFFEYLIIGGGSSGGGADDVSGGGGGGGAGGVISGSIFLDSGNYSITVGAGGKRGSASTGYAGNNSSAFGFTAIGGGISNGGRLISGSSAGGSGGGGFRTNAGGSGTPGQGNDGGSGGGSTSAGGGGGGGAGSPGQNGGLNSSGDNSGGNGGIGIISSITGEPKYYAGGGGGGPHGSDIPGKGGAGAGGNGAPPSNRPEQGHDAIDGTGGGGGGGATINDFWTVGSGGRGGNGGNGIVIVRHSTNQGVFVHKPITREGLQMNLDAGLSRCIRSNGDWLDAENNINNVNFFESSLYEIPMGTAVNDYGGVYRFDGSINSNTFGWQGDEFSGPGSSRAWEAWIKPESSSQQGIFGHKTGSGCSYYCNFGLYIYEGEYSINWYDNSTYRWLKTGVPVQTNQWAHVVGTCIGDIPKIYLNGELKATYGVTNLNYSAPNGMSIWNIAYNDKDAGQDRFQGDMAILRFYRPGLSDTQVKQNFEADRHRFGL